jgi:hypothetical protein
VSRAWMQEFCGESARTMLATPFRATVDGEEWDCAATHCVLLMVRGAPEFEARASAPPVDQIVAMPRKDPVTVSLLDLLVWAYSSEADDECDECGAVDHSDAPGFLCGTRLNRRLLWEKLVLLPRSETVQVSGGAGECDVLLVESPEWRLFVMPMLPYGETPESEAELPRFP